MDKEFIKNPDELGAVWSRTSAKGRFLSGYIEHKGEKIQIVMFPIDKKSENSPSFRILKSKPLESAPNGVAWNKSSIEDIIF